MTIKRIIRLDSLISNQIAAGEVVEKPASVVKELIENAIDAHATKIEIETEGGGIHLIRVRDNGHGIVKEDLELAFCRHATSKITSTRDLEKIMSLGFRGEALASIVSVSKCRLISKTSLDNDAWQIIIHPDLSSTLSLASHSIGTTIEVADLFYNTPVRRRFLRSEKSENLAIEEMIKRLALAYPQITFSYKQNQKVVRQYIGAHDIASQEARVAKICGQAFMEQAVSLTFENEGLHLHGWIGLPLLSKRQADCQFFFVNRRMVKDRLLNHAIKSLYLEHPESRQGTYPAYVLFLELNPVDVDVNVHPTKQEVRFSQSRLIHDFITKGVQQAWFETPYSTIDKANYSTCRSHDLFAGLSAASRSNSVRMDAADNPWHVDEEKAITEKKYLLFETPNGVQIIDSKLSKLALYARYFEKNQGNIPMKRLLFPLRCKASVTLFTEKVIQLFQHYGFECQQEQGWFYLYQQPIFLIESMTEEQCLDLARNVGHTGKVDFFLEKLFSLFSDKPLSTLDWSHINLTNVPSVLLSHDDIEKALKV